jgi:hypothetical protein
VSIILIKMKFYINWEIGNKKIGIRNRDNGRSTGCYGYRVVASEFGMG